MDTFEKEMAKKQLVVLKSINANISFLGKELKRTNDILEKFNGIAVFPTEHIEEKGENDETEE